MSTKLCKKCAERPATKSKARHGYCKQCWANYMRSHYARNSAGQRERSRKRYERLRGLVWAAKDKPCADCGGEFPPYVMHFDHRPDEIKVREVSKLMSLGREAAMLAEIEKCDVVCANCHAIRTHDRLQLVQGVAV